MWRQRVKKINFGKGYFTMVEPSEVLLWSLNVNLLLLQPPLVLSCLDESQSGRRRGLQYLATIYSGAGPCGLGLSSPFPYPQLHSWGCSVRVPLQVRGQVWNPSSPGKEERLGFWVLRLLCSDPQCARGFGLHQQLRVFSVHCQTFTIFETLRGSVHWRSRYILVQIVQCANYWLWSDTYSRQPQPASAMASVEPAISEGLRWSVRYRPHAPGAPSR